MENKSHDTLPFPLDAKDWNNDRLLSNLQGNILKGHGRNNTVHFFVRFDAKEKSAVLEWISDFAEDQVTSFKEQLRQRELYKRNKMPGALFSGIYFTRLFYAYLHPDGFNAQPVLSAFADVPFKEGMKARKEILHDNDSSKWDGALDKDIHAMILLAHDDLIKLNEAAKSLCETLNPSAEEMKEHNKVKLADILHVEYGTAIRNANGDGLEHFGYVDGISQPLFLKDEIEQYIKSQPSFVTDGKPVLHFDPSASPELVLVADPLVPEVPQAYGSYFVFRKLEQNVKNFKEAEKQLAKDLNITDPEEAERVGAMIVGRFEDGTPVTLTDEDKMIGSGIINNFDYNRDFKGTEADDKGARCPFHGHIRKTNPRRNDEDKKHRMARRGITYGHRNVSTTTENHFVQMPTDGVGLLFMSFQASIEKQFEHIQTQWANSLTHPHSDNTFAGLDLIIGQVKDDADKSLKKRTETDVRTCPYAKTYNDPNSIERHHFKNFITLRGGEYFFAPSIPFLKSLKPEEDKDAEGLIKSVAMIFCLLLLHAVQAQTEERKLDWQNLPASIEKTIVGNPVPISKFTIFKITDINKFLYKVEIKGTVFELETPVPTELQTLFRLNRTELEETVENKSAEEGAALIPEAFEPMKSIKSAAQESLQQKTKLRETLPATAAESVKQKQDMEISKLQALVKDLNKLIKICEEYAKLADQVAHDILKLKSDRSEFISIAQMDLPMKEIMDKVDAIKPPSPKVKTDYMNMKQKYREAEVWYHKVEAYETDNVLLKPQIEAVKESLDKIEEADELIDETSLIALYTDVGYLYTELKNPNSYIVVAPPVQMDADLVRYAIKITPTRTSSLGAYKNPTEFNFEVPTKGGLKVDFSVGPVLSFGSEARDRKYFLEEVSGQTTVTLRSRSNKNALTPSIAAMLHAYSRTGKYSGFGGMFGIGAGFQSEESIDANLFFGASYVWGKKQKLMLSGGVSYLRVDRLKDGQFAENTVYETAKMNLVDVTEKVFRPSPYLAVSYNLSNRVEIK